MSTYQYLFIPLLLLSVLDVTANSRRIIEYAYDNAGNIIIVDTAVSQQPPQISALIPAIVRAGQENNVLANGTGLQRVNISSNSSHIIVSNIVTDDIQAEFILNISDSIVPGDYTLTFSTVLGTSSQTITVFPPLPAITLNPAPVLLPFQGLSVELDIQLSQKDIIAHTLNLTIDNPAVAQLQTTTLNIPIGQTRPAATIQITGLQKGAATLNISSSTLEDFSTRIFVTDPYSPAIGSHTAIANPLGIILGQTVSPPPLPVRGPFSTQLGIIKSQSDPLGEISINPLLSQPLTIAKGAVISAVNLIALIADSGSTVVTIQGIGLENVDNVTFFPPEGITIGSLTAAADGSNVIFTVSVDPGVEIGTREIVLTQQGNKIFTTDLNSARITIVQDLADIETIDPIIVTRISEHTLMVRGSHFESTRSLTITPADGITMAAPITISADGTLITTDIIVDKFASLGDRVVRVETDAGITSSILTPSNTLTVINGPDKNISFLTAPSLGVIKTITATQDMHNIDVRNNRMGVVYGSHIGSLSPAFQAIGSDFSLTINGSGLSDVVSVSFIPDDNIFVGIPTIAADGLSLTVSVSIDVDAAKTMRRVLVETIDSTINATSVSADRFQVTDLQPIVSSLSPNFLIADDNFISLKIRGQSLDAITSVFAIPGDDILIGIPQTNASGTEVTVDIKAAVGAQTNVRVIVLETAGGQSSNIPTPANSLHIVSSQPTVFNALVSTQLGIDKTTITNPPLPTQDLLITSPLMGIVRQTTPPPGTIDQDQHAGHLGVLLGNAATGTTPRLAPINSSFILTVNGLGLDQVTDISLNPADDLILTTAFNVNSNGTQLTVPIDVAVNAELTQREIVLTTASGKLPFVNIEDSRLLITGLLPIIQSIDPIQEFPGTTPTLLVRGFNLNNAISVEASPINGDISFGSISVNTAGTELQIAIAISPSATPGTRVITVTTPAGVTESQATPANTFTILPLP